jgi:hypothetical protein|tara:strand:+ start:12437 stop:13045 length:609 start_codon:yes stop_codon:yes gene_type:complete
MSNIFFDTPSGLPVIFIRDFYSNIELTSIFNELKFLSSIDRFKDPTDPDGPGTAMSNGVVLKSGKGMHLDVVYKDRSESDILKVNRKLFSKETTTLLESYHSFFRYVRRSNADNTKLHYYTNGDYYKSHVDDCVVTAISFFNIEPKGYRGGDLVLEHRLKIPCLNNSLVVFPSIMWHEVTPIVMYDFSPNMGRYSMTQFLEM